LLSLEGKVALVTGAGGGIGAAVVRGLLGAGASVASVDLPGHECVEASVEIPCDVADARGVADLFTELCRRFDRLDVVIHCAGITSDAVLWKMQDEAWERVLRVNLDSAFFVLRNAIPLMRELGEGAIVLISSINGERGKFGQANYAASKAGLIGLARTAARELGKLGIRVNVIAPGLIRTAMTEALPAEVIEAAIGETALGRVGEPEDVARAALFLATPLSRHVTGQVLRVDGGQLIA
jgi:NAD(P)-dependent dehydrogenase (short-subunit alcohol dehydrogenase family)